MVDRWLTGTVPVYYNIFINVNIISGFTSSIDLELSRLHWFTGYFEYHLLLYEPAWPAVVIIKMPFATCLCIWRLCKQDLLQSVLPKLCAFRYQECILKVWWLAVFLWPKDTEGETSPWNVLFWYTMNMTLEIRIHIICQFYDNLWYHSTINDGCILKKLWICSPLPNFAAMQFGCCSPLFLLLLLLMSLNCYF